MQTHAAALASGLHERGHQVVVVAYGQSEDPAAAAAYDAAQPFPSYRCLGRLSYWANVRAVLQLVDELRPDVVYCSTPFYGIVRVMAGVPVVCRSVGNDVMRCWVPYPFRFGSRLLGQPAVERRLYGLYQRLGAPEWLEDALLSVRRELVRRAACAASLLVANSHYTRDRLLELGVDPAAIAVVPGGVDSARFAGGPAPELRSGLSIQSASPVALTVCRLVTKKGVDVLLRAVALAQRELPGLVLLVVGDGPERGKCERLAAQLGLNGTVRFVGRVPHQQIVDYYRATDCFVLASRVHQRRNGWADVETMGRVICEANAAGVPVVASDTGGIPSLVEDGRNGLLVPPDDAAALAAAIARLWRHPTLRARLRAGGLQRARQDFDWSVVIAAYEELFRGARGQG